jgi:hypothetical protein
MKNEDPKHFPGPGQKPPKTPKPVLSAGRWHHPTIKADNENMNFERRMNNVVRRTQILSS